MLDENCKELLDEEDALLTSVRDNCARFVTGDHSKSDSVHRWIYVRLDTLLPLARAFKDADFSQPEEKKQACKDGIGVAKDIGLLAQFMLINKDCAGPFREQALEKHAETMGNLMRQRVKIVRDLL